MTAWLLFAASLAFGLSGMAGSATGYPIALTLALLAGGAELHAMGRARRDSQRRNQARRLGRR